MNQRLPRAMVTIAAALIFLGGQLGALAHNAFVEHAICAEHGELIHTDEQHAGEDEHHVSPEPGDTILTQAPAPGEDEHDHCASCSLAREKANTVSQSATVMRPLDSESVAMHAPDVAIRVATIHRLAPKQSPPA